MKSANNEQKKIKNINIMLIKKKLYSQIILVKFNSLISLEIITQSNAKKL